VLLLPVGTLVHIPKMHQPLDGTVVLARVQIRAVIYNRPPPRIGGL
jgi:hypothetical protein